MFTLATSCLTTSNLPWFMDLTFQVPKQYCSLQDWTLLQSPVTSTTGYCFCCGSVSSFFLDLFLHSSLVVYWAPTNLGNSSFSALSFWLFILFVMPKSQNLPMTTGELISDAKAREFLLPSSSWGSHRYWRSGRTTDWLPSCIGLCVDF